MRHSFAPSVPDHFQLFWNLCSRHACGGGFREAWPTTSDTDAATSLHHYCEKTIPRKGLSSPQIHVQLVRMHPTRIIFFLPLKVRHESIDRFDDGILGTPGTFVLTGLRAPSYLLNFATGPAANRRPRTLRRTCPPGRSSSPRVPRETAPGAITGTANSTALSTARWFSEDRETVKPRSFGATMSPTLRAAAPVMVMVTATDLVTSVTDVTRRVTADGSGTLTGAI